MRASRSESDARSSPQHPESALPLRHICKMILGALPHRLEDERFGQEELDVVVGPRVRGEALQEHDHFLCDQLTPFLCLFLSYMNGSRDCGTVRISEGAQRTAKVGRVTSTP